MTRGKFSNDRSPAVTIRALVALAEHDKATMSTVMPPIPTRNDTPPPTGDGFFAQTETPEQPQQANADQAITGKLQLFRTADEMVSNIARASTIGGKYGEQIKQLLKAWMMEEVASQRTTDTANPRIFGA